MIQSYAIESDVIVAICALFVSVVSLVTSIYFSWCARDHNRKSFKPIPFIQQLDYEDRIAVIVQNNGTGPLILKKAQAINLTDGQLGHLIDLIPAQPAGILFTNFTKIRQVRAILPGQKVSLIDLPVDLADSIAVNYRDDLRKALGNMKVKLTYTDIYDTRFPVYAIALTWFHRHQPED